MEMKKIRQPNQQKPLQKPIVLKHEKPKLPTFYGDVRKYFIFREDFKHAVKNAAAAEIYRNTTFLSWTRAAKLIEGISSDLKAAWRYLDQNYGDPGLFLTLSQLTWKDLTHKARRRSSFL